MEDTYVREMTISNVEMVASDECSDRWLAVLEQMMVGLVEPNDGWRWTSGFDTMLKERKKERAKENSIYKTVQVEAYTYRHTYG